MFLSISTRRSVYRRSLYKAFHNSPSAFARVKVIRPFLLADIGEGITECEVIKWSVGPSSTVQQFDALCEVQSDKATVDITSPYEGIVKELLVKEGDIAKVGSGLCLIEVEEEEAEAAENPPAKVASKTPLLSTEAQETPVPPAQTQQDRKPHPLNPEHPKLGSSDAHILATPSVRHFARQNGITDLSVLSPGSGKGGRLEKADVDAYLLNKTSLATPSTTGRSQEQVSNVTVEFGRTRWAMWKSMTKSLEIPHFGYSTTLDLTSLSNLLPTLNAHIPPQFNPPLPPQNLSAVSPYSIYPTPPPQPSSDVQTHYNHLTFLPLLLKTLSKAMQDWPLFRSSLSQPTYSLDTKPNLTIRPGADISIALSTPTGLYTPTILGLQKMNPYEIMGELKRLSSLGRRVPSGLTVKEMPRCGGTITVSNIGAVGKGEWAMPLLVPGGGVAIVAIGRAKWVERDGEKRLEVGTSWSADHRVVEGAELAAFIETWRGWVENPERLVGESR